MRNVKFKEFITENVGRVDVLRQKYEMPLMHMLFPALRKDSEKYEETYTTLFNKIQDADPSLKKVYLQWILNLFIKKNIQLSDLDKVKEDLTIFDRVKQRVPQERRDVNRYKAYQDLYDVVKEFGETKSNKDLKREEVARFKTEIITLYDGPEGSVYIPKSKDASCYLGRGTRWCTASTNSANYFDSYARSGNLVIFILENGMKFQYHMKGEGLTYERFQNIENADQFRNMLLGGGEFRDSADRVVPNDSVFYKHTLIKKLAALPKFSPFILNLAFRTSNADLLNAAKQYNKKVLDEMKENADDFIEMGKDGALSRYQDVINAFKFVKANYR